jgi:hypothetical protein
MPVDPAACLQLLLNTGSYLLQGIYTASVFKSPKASPAAA